MGDPRRDFSGEDEERTEEFPLNLDDQIGFMLRRAYQRHVALFNQLMPEDLTPTQSSALIRLLERGPMSQNRLGRRIALDASTIKGVVDRLTSRGLVTVESDTNDQRRVVVSLSEEGRAYTRGFLAQVSVLATETLKPLSEAERSTFLAALRRIC